LELKNKLTSSELDYEKLTLQPRNISHNYVEQFMSVLQRKRNKEIAKHFTL